MEIIVVNRILEKEEEDHISSCLTSADRDIQLYSNITLSDKLERFSKGSIELSSDEKREINYELFRHVLNFGEIKIGETAITDLLMVEKASIWHYHKFRTYFFIRNLTYEIRLIEKLSKSHQRISYYGDSEYLKEYPFSFPGLTIHVKESKQAKVNYRTLITYSAFFIIRALNSYLKFKKLKTAKHIVIDHSIKQTCLNLRTLKPEPGNYNLAYLFEKLDEDFIVLDDIDIPKFHKGSEFKLNRDQFKSGKNKLFGEYILFKGLLSREVRKQNRSVSSGLVEKYNQVESYLTNPFDQIIIKHLRSLHSSSKLFLFKYFAYKSFFSKHKFKTVSTIDENSPRIKSILDASKSNGIKTIGIQHGTIHDLHPAYMFTLNDRERKMIPDRTIIWGERWKELLSNKGNYDPESLFITGQIRTDIIPALKNSKIKGVLNIPENSRVVLFASQPQQDPELREKSAFDVFTAMSNIPNAHLVVKLHPAEKNDMSYYKEIARKAGCNNYQIIYHIDLYLLISLSDVVITCFSTVGAETVYFNKPLIILDHLKQDIQGYHKEGIALQAIDQEELKNYILKFLNGQLSIKAENYSNYIRNFAFKIDGKVGERIINFIKDPSKN
jgi:CDP-glycerol glycerophosphotransferase (TagB/SpsB family)